MPQGGQKIQQHAFMIIFLTSTEKYSIFKIKLIFSTELITKFYSVTSVLINTNSTTQ